VATVGAVLAILAFLGLAYLAGRVASARGRPFWLYVVAGLIVGPLALIAALILPTRRLG
jgi:hypothetical protein